MSSSFPKHAAPKQCSVRTGGVLDAVNEARLAAVVLHHDLRAELPRVALEGLHNGILLEPGGYITRTPAQQQPGIPRGLS